MGVVESSSIVGGRGVVARMDTGLPMETMVVTWQRQRMVAIPLH